MCIVTRNLCKLSKWAVNQTKNMSTHRRNIGVNLADA